MNRQLPSCGPTPFPAFPPLGRGIVMLLLVCCAVVTSSGKLFAIRLILPTGNDALLNGDEEGFYQHTAGSRANPWESGKFGYVRNPKRTAAGTMFTRFHEGVDIKPLYRDSRGVPLDSVRSIDDGVVVHVNAVAGHSNYGKYIVVRHFWDGSPYYSLYAHLNEVWIDSGQIVRQGDAIGRLGYTGDGINKARAHLHFEIGLLLSDHFDAWFDEFHRGEVNRNGNFNGQNLAGLDVARLYLTLCEHPDITIPEFLLSEDPYFRVEIPGERNIDLLRRYPWLLAPAADSAYPCRSWALYFTRAGLPLRIVPGRGEIDQFVAALECPTPTTCRYIRGRESCALTQWGEHYIELLTATGYGEEDRKMSIGMQEESRAR